MNCLFCPLHIAIVVAVAGFTWKFVDTIWSTALLVINTKLADRRFRKQVEEDQERARQTAQLHAPIAGHGNYN
jgi:hypothetical protein